MDFLFGDITVLLQTIGIIGVFAVIFAESGFLIGLVLPGDSLLFTAGVLAAHEYFNIVALIIAAFLGAVLGDSVGYAFGKKVGPALFKREDSILFHKDHLARAERFYERFGGMTIVYARFLPVIRTFAPIVAGVGKMPYKKFLAFNIIGGCLWAIGLPLLGFFLGNVIPNIERYLATIVLGIVGITVILPIIHALANKHTREELKKIVSSLRSSKK